MSTTRSITADCASDEGTTVTFDSVDASGIEDAIIRVQIDGVGPHIFLTAEDLQTVTEFIHREIQRHIPPNPF